MAEAQSKGHRAKCRSGSINPSGRAKGSKEGQGDDFMRVRAGL